MACLETDFLIALIRKDKDALKKLKQLVEKGEKIIIGHYNRIIGLEVESW